MNRLKHRTTSIRKWLAITAISLTLVLFSSDGLDLSAAQKAAAPHAYDIVGWHLTNFASKWVHWLRNSPPWLNRNESDRLHLVDLYFRSGSEVRKLAGEVDSYAAHGDDVTALENRLAALRRTRMSIRNDVEEAIESEISTAVRSQGLGLVGEIVLPPVDVRLEDPPRVLITSPRDRIERLEGVLVEPGITVGAREEVESRIMSEQDISALVLDIGGVATYPASIYTLGDLHGTLRIAAHEWLHHYLFLKPLGRDPYATRELMVVNETVASIAGDEIGDMAYGAMKERMPRTVSVSLGPPGQGPHTFPAPNAEFDFGSRMRETRIAVDQLLAEGRLDQAEAYMEEQRQTFVANGHPIRKLNQAYFAFNGTYADSPASVDPIGPQVRRLRELSRTVGEFVELVGGVSTYQAFLALLERLEQSREPS